MSLINFITATAKKIFVNELLKKKPLFFTSTSISAIVHINKKFVFTENCKSGITKTILLY